MTKSKNLCVRCGKHYDRKDLIRQLGEDSMVVQTDHCSASCYTKAVVVDKNKDLDLVKQVENLKELVERTKNQRDEYYDRMRKSEDRVDKYQKVRAKLSDYLNTELGVFQGYGVYLSNNGKGIVLGLQEVKRKLENWEAE